MVDSRSEAVKVVWEWRVQPGVQDRFTKWLEQLVAAATTAPGFEGSSVFSAQHDWLLLLRFARHADLVSWRDSPAAIAMFAASASLASRAEQPQQRTGLETWFVLPGQTAVSPPPRWKMALMTWLALLPQVIILALVMPASIPFPLNVALSTAIPVAMLTWVVMPRLTKLLYRWLYREPRPA
jgi:hypothetical protein